MSLQYQEFNLVMNHAGVEDLMASRGVVADCNQLNIPRLTLLHGGPKKHERHSLEREFGPSWLL